MPRCDGGRRPRPERPIAESVGVSGTHEAILRREDWSAPWATFGGSSDGRELDVKPSVMRIARGRESEMSNSMVSRRNALRTLGAGALAAVGTSISLLPAAAARAGMPAEAQFNGGPPRRRRGSILMDGHVHITNKIFWLGVDPWQPTPTNTGWDYARAAAAGINVIIENPSPYGYWSYNMTPKHILRLFETFHRFAEANEEKMTWITTRDDRGAADGPPARSRGLRGA